MHYAHTHMPYMYIFAYTHTYITHMSTYSPIHTYVYIYALTQTHTYICIEAWGRSSGSPLNEGSDIRMCWKEEYICICEHVHIHTYHICIYSNMHV